MPSGKRARQQRQAAVPRPPAGAAGGLGARRASSRALAIAGGVIVLVIVAVVLAIVLSNGSGSGNGAYDGPIVGVVTSNGIPAVGSSSWAGADPLAGQVAKLLNGIPQNGLELGNPNAPVTLIEYIDLQCPDCQAFETTEMPTLINTFVRPGKLKIKMQPWSILDRTPTEYDSDRGQKATIAASFQNKAFNFAEVLYDNQGVEGTGWMNDAAISNIAASVDGLNLQRLATDANGSATASIVKSITDWAKAHPTQMTGTPTIYLQKGLAPPVYYGTGVPQLSSLEAAINALLPGSGK